MQVIGSLRSARKLQADQAAEDSLERLSLYTTPPQHEISLDEFEQFAIDRLQVLKKLEMLKAQGARGLDLKNGINSCLSKFGLAVKDAETQQKDNASHFILRLAYCRSEELRRWFLANESELFRFRFENETSANIERFMEKNGLHYESIDDEDRAEIEEELKAVFYTTYRQGESKLSVDAAFSTCKFYRVPFTQVLDLVRRRRVFIQAGYAFVPHTQLLSIIQARFRLNLSRDLTTTAKTLAHVYQDDRISPFLKNLSKINLGNDYSKSAHAGGKVTPDMIEALSKQSFPLCMRELHGGLRRNAHLKHQGRMQYGLFLKGIGLSLDDAITFWRTAFAKKTSPEQFVKQYQYNIRHNYGKEGKRADYTPYSCTKIIMGNAPGHGESHGCPFKHFDETHLTAALRRLRVGASDIGEIVGLAKDQHYQLACRQYFVASHKEGAPSGTVIDAADKVGNHPNAYFDASLEHLRAIGAMAKTAAKSSAGAAAAGGSSSSSSSSSSSAAGAGAKTLAAPVTARPAVAAQ